MEEEGDIEHTCRVQRIDINAQVYGLLAHSLPDLLDDTRRTDGVDFSGLDNLKPAIAVIVVVAQSGEGGTDAGVDVAVVGEEAFGVSVIEVSAVVDCGLGGRGAAEDARTPGVTVEIGCEWKITGEVKELWAEG